MKKGKNQKTPRKQRKQDTDRHIFRGCHIMQKRRVIFWYLQVLVSVLWIAFSGWLGLQYSTQVGSHFSPAEKLDFRYWSGKTSDVQQNSSREVKGASIVDGVLRIDKDGSISPWNKQKIRKVELSLSSYSSGIRLELEGPGGHRSLDLGSKYWYNEVKKQWVDCQCDGKFILENTQRGIALSYGKNSQYVSNRPFEKMEITSRDGKGEIQAIKVFGTTEKPFLNEDYSQREIAPQSKNIGIGMGAFLGFAWVFVLWVRGIGFGSLLGLVCIYAPTYWLAGIRAADWDVVIKKMYLAQSVYWELSILAVWASIFPAVWILCTHMGLGIKKMSEKRHLWGLVLWIIAVLGVWLWSHHQGDAHLVWGMRLVFLLLPIRILLQKKIPVWGWAIRDIPALLSICLLGWGLGFLIAVLWRILIIFVSTPVLLKVYGRALIDSLVVLMLLLPLGLESTIRETYLHRAWDVDRLTLSYNSEDPTLFLVPAWKGSCGDKPAKENLNLVFTGGSSTGGDFQFRQTPELFFAGQGHTLLCSKRKEGQRLYTSNFGRGGMDTHIMARTMTELIAMTKADIVVIYVGNNDLLTRDLPVSKKQLEDQTRDWKAQFTGIKKYSSRSRLIIGSSLFFRKLNTLSRVVSNVSVADAELNFDMMAKKAAKTNTKLVLLPEYLRPSIFQKKTSGSGFNIKKEFSDYRDMQASIAKKYPHVYYVDMWAHLGQYGREDLFIDNNHLNKQGNRRVAEGVVPILIDLLGMESPQK